MDTYKLQWQNFMREDLIWAQSFNAIQAFTAMLISERFERVIEIGSGSGVLTLLIAIGVYPKRVIAVDLVEPHPLIKRIIPDNVKFVHGDVFELLDMLKEEIGKEGKTLVLCDNGNKPKEFAVMKEFLKEGDVICVHDWMEEFKSENAGEWIGKMTNPHMLEAHWICFRK